MQQTTHNNFLLELFSEEIPARMQNNALNILQERLIKALSEARLTHGKVTGFVTPRRLAVRVEGLPNMQPSLESERKGPKIDAPAGAIEGFCRSVGLSKEQLEIQEKDGTKFFFAIIKQAGQPTTQALKPIIENILQDFPWPKSQRWGAYNMHWVRPLRRIIAILNAEIIPVEFGHIIAANITEGHRFLSKGEIIINDPMSYETILEKNYVIADAKKRSDLIEKQAHELTKAANLSLRADAGLLEEVTGLVEWPICLMGEFSEDFLNLPPEVPVLEMRHHQKYFACLDNSEKLANRFITVSNITASDGGKAIIHGNQRVLRARLEDGRFFWNQDRKRNLSDWQADLEKIIFHAKLGSVAEKVRRITSLATMLAVFVPYADLEKVERAAKLCKSDLASGMVGEFPELQGVMGRYYALEQKESAEIADAIRDHYKPIGSEDSLPSAPVSICVALADKLDTLVGLFAAGEKPTGSKDPFALRRAALGILRIILNQGLRIKLDLILTQALNQYPKELVKIDNKQELIAELTNFFFDRLRVILKEQNIRHDLLEAILGKDKNSAKSDDLIDLVLRLNALQEFLSQEAGGNLLAAYRRAANIVSSAEKKDQKDYNISIKTELFVEEVERELYAKVEQVKTTSKVALEKEDYAQTLQILSSLREALDNFFDKIMVNDENPAIRTNRLALLANIRDLIDAVADFSVIGD